MGFGSEMGERKRVEGGEGGAGGRGPVSEDEPEQTAGLATNRPPSQGNMLDANGYNPPPCKTHPSTDTQIRKSDSSPETSWRKQVTKYIYLYILKKSEQ